MQGRFAGLGYLQNGVPGMILAGSGDTCPPVGQGNGFARPDRPAEPLPASAELRTRPAIPAG